MVTKTLNGPGGLRIELDSREIFPDDPGQGTPAMVYCKGQSATYWCALNEGEVFDDEPVQLTATQLNWLAAQEGAVGEFMEQHSPAT